MIVRLIAIDPNPRPGETDVLVYQVPEGSRAMELLCEMFEERKIEFIVLEPALRKRAKKSEPYEAPPEPQ